MYYVKRGCKYLNHGICSILIRSPDFLFNSVIASNVDVQSLRSFKNEKDITCFQFQHYSPTPSPRPRNSEGSKSFKAPPPIHKHTNAYSVEVKASGFECSNLMCKRFALFHPIKKLYDEHSKYFVISFTYSAKLALFNRHILIPWMLGALIKHLIS